ncbi:radical SAM protein [Mesorhizobium sp. M8A.F.Ca.ET.021.01.1.1]|uniref:B12-binding domain-containing radical SAM protein n=1 Tax=Mesorhizobium sp. M8A.F.Ca.ET.021.01.1.1 TaxID=2496757 RepID=UPI000FCC4EE4|nr:radical SAM protein [Mesorhizobium sp. M8A.F.Ca.ET.021.01.1.1]RUW57010.1 B12-binding domain-containing radical SAM protein [Mesorhizobium sp. M8A.F.Ca.ET.021.01.1.1]
MHISLVTTLSYAHHFGCEQRSNIVREYPFPLGLLTLAGVVKSLGHTVDLVDLNLEATECGMGARGLYQILAGRVLSSSPDVIGFTTMCDSYHHTLRIAEELKKMTNVPIVLGGPQATAVDIATLNGFPAIDFIVRGEGEVAFPELLLALDSGTSFEDVRSATFRENGVCTRAMDAPLLLNLDDQPLPDFSYYAFLDRQVHFLPIEAGRGCPFKCDFCSTALFFNRTYRLKGAARLEAEMASLESLFGGGRTFRFVHDMLTVNRNLVGRMCEGLATLSPKRVWSSSARIDCVRPPMLQTMVNAGCNEIYFGIETGSASLQKRIKKNLRLDAVQLRVAEAVELGMTVTCSFMAGFPDETVDDLNESLGLIIALIKTHRSRIAVQMHLLAPYVGTELYERYKDELQFDGYSSDQTGQPVSDADVDMIKRHPELFSNFYYVEGRAMARSQIVGVDTFVYLVLGRFPLTISALQSSGHTPFQIFRLWQAAALSENEPSAISAINTNIDVVVDAIRRMLNRVSNPTRAVARQLFLYECAFVDLAGAHPSQGTAETPTPVRACISLNIDIERAWEAVCDDKLPEVLPLGEYRRYCLVFDRVTGSGRCIQVSAFASSIIRFLDRGMSFGEALPEIARITGLGDSSARSAAIGLIDVLYGNDIVTDEEVRWTNLTAESLRTSSIEEERYGV